MSLVIQHDRLVTLFVRMADMTGKVLEETGPEGLTYLHGHGDIFPKIEEALDGHFKGEGFFLKLEPEDAFGDYDPDALRMVPVRELGDDPEAITPGLCFASLPGDDTPGKWYVTDVADGVAVLEANHPYAGWALQFEIRVLDVEDPDTTDVVGNDDTVVPSFLSVADQLVSEDDDMDEEALLRKAVADAEPSDAMAGLMKTPRIIR